MLPKIKATFTTVISYSLLTVFLITVLSMVGLLLRVPWVLGGQ